MTSSKKSVSDFGLTPVGAAWASYYRPGMTRKEAKAFKAGYAAATVGDREPQPSDGPDFHSDHAAWDRRNQRPGESDKDYAKRLGYGKNDYGAPGYDPSKRDTTWDNYSMGDRYTDH